jgi:ATP synthase protein I
MNEKSEKPRNENESDKDQNTLIREVGAKAARKLKAKQNPTPGVWFGLGMMGLIGWSVVVPTLLGAALGFWIDNRHAGSYSWTLMLLILGLILGCLNAWHWVSKENKEIHEDQEDKDE